MKATSNKILFIILTTLAITLSIYTDHFATIENIYDITNNYSMLMILSCGLFIVLLSGGIDISFPAMTIISQYIMISFISHYDIGFINVFLISSVVGTLLGFTNAILVNKLNVPSIIITISTLNIFYGALLYITKGVWLYDYPEWFQEEFSFL
ncbi:ABC transporter permease [Pasteurella multocida]